MLHKYYVEGVSNRFNLKFYSPTADDGIWTMPNIRFNLRDAIFDAMEDDVDLRFALSGYKQYLYLEKSENTKRYWNVAIGIWDSKSDFDSGFDPVRIVRVTTDDFTELVRDKYNDEFYQYLPLSVWYDDNIRTFY